MSRFRNRPHLQKVALALFATAIVSSAFQGPQPVAWAVSEVAETIPVGVEKSIAVKFRVNRDLYAVAVDLTPSLDPAVTVTPRSFPSLAAGREYTLSLTIAVSSATPRAIRGTLHLRDAQRSLATYSTPLPISITVDLAPELMLQDLSRLIVSGNIDAALKYFSPARINSEVLSGLTADRRRMLGEAFRNARLVKASPGLRIYASPGTEADGSTRDIRFSVGYRTDTNTWFVVSW